MKTKNTDYEDEIPEEKWSVTLVKIIKSHAPFKWKLLVSFLLILVNNLFQAAAPFFIGLIVTQLTKGAEFNQILLSLSGLATCYMLFVATWQIHWLWEVKYMDLAIPDHLKGMTLKHLGKLSIGQHRNKHAMVTISKVSTGESSLRNFCSLFFYNLMPILISAIATVTIMTLAYPKIGIITALIATAVIAHSVRVASIFAEPVDKYREFHKKNVSKSDNELVMNMSSLTVANEKKRYADLNKTQRLYRFRMFKKIFSSLSYGFLFGQICSGLGKVIIFGMTAVMIYIGEYEIGAFASILVWTGQSIGPLQRLNFIVRNMIESWSDIVQYFRIMDLKPAIEPVDHPVELQTIGGEIAFNNVCFSYPGTNENALTAVSFKIEPGQKVGIVGPTGSGKSTLLSLLQVAYLPDLGSIRIDGIDLTNVDQDSYRNNIGFIEQNPLILSRSLRENLTFGLSNERRRSITDAELNKVLKLLELEDLIPRLRKNVGDFGVKLSGGQKQRIVIARMLLKKPDMLIVDEGTSAVDPKTEKLIHEQLDHLSPGATRIFVAHRISTVQNSDFIIVMNNGMIEATGKHDDLLETCGLYEELVRNSLLRT